MLLAKLALLHGNGSYMGRNFCAVVQGPESAVDHTVNVMGHTVTIENGSCNPLMMGGKP